MEPSVCLTAVCYNSCFVLVHNFDFVLYNNIGPGLKMLCMNMVRTLGCVRIVIVPSITRFQTGKNLTLLAAPVLFVVLQADAIDKKPTQTDNFKFRHPVVFSYN